MGYTYLLVLVPEVYRAASCLKSSMPPLDLASFSQLFHLPQKFHVPPVLLFFLRYFCLWSLSCLGLVAFFEIPISASPLLHLIYLLEKSAET